MLNQTRPWLMCVDIGANLTDGMYQGRYHGKQYHDPDLTLVLQRAWESGVQKIIITAGTLSEAREALELARSDARLFCTAGVHPTRCSEIEQHAAGADAYMKDLRQVCVRGRFCPHWVCIASAVRQALGLLRTQHIMVKML